MTVIKVLGKVIGAKLTNAEKAALTIEVRKQLAEDTRKHDAEIDAIVLWFLHTELGLGKKRLRWAHSKLGSKLEELCKRYEMSDPGDDVWLCTRELKEYGVDVEAWNNEKEGD